MSVELVGILNLTPDSFSDGALYVNPVAALDRVEQMFAEGASMIDIGAEATNPSADAITIDEEWSRLEPVLGAILPSYEGLISLDTRHPEIVKRALELGRFIVNDITTFIDPEMIRVAAENDLTVIASHLPVAARGDIQFAHQYMRIEHISQVWDELFAQKAKMIEGGILDHRIILDPGIGFGKSMLTNWGILTSANHYDLTNHQLMLGYSRKRFLATDQHTGQLIEGLDREDPIVNLAAGKIALRATNDKVNLLLRVHDVAAHRELRQPRSAKNNSTPVNRNVRLLNR
jgi:dihydropteroate synthase